MNESFLTSKLGSGSSRSGFPSLGLVGGWQVRTWFMRASNPSVSPRVVRERVLVEHGELHAPWTAGY